jgi:apolipoprotein N-acyltransferase
MTAEQENLVGATPTDTRDTPRQAIRSPIRWTRHAGWLLIGALLVGFSTGDWNAPLAAWLGPAFILRYARDQKPGRGFVGVFGANVLALAIGFWAAWSAQWSPQTAPILAVAYGLFWSLPYLADRLLTPRVKGFPATLAYPLAACTLEFLIVHLNPVGAWGATGFTQYGNLTLLQLASVTGMIGITFLMGWFASVANWAWENRAQSRAVTKGIAGFAVAFAVVYAFGVVRLSLAPSADVDETIRVAGVTAADRDRLVDEVGAAPDETAVERAVEAHWESYFAATVQEADAGATLVIWPELAGSTYTAGHATEMIDRAHEIARSSGVYLAFGLWDEPRNTGQTPSNRFVLIDPTGTTVIDHEKYGGSILEGSEQGDGILQSVDTPFGTVSGIICWDMDFPTVIQQAGSLGTGLMLAPSRDWREIDPSHSHMAAARAIENGMSVVRQTDRGLSIAYDPYGRTLAQSDFFGTTDRTLVAQVPVAHVVTAYTLFGRWFEWVLVAAFTGLALSAALSKGGRRSDIHPAAE